MRRVVRPSAVARGALAWGAAAFGAVAIGALGIGFLKLRKLQLMEGSARWPAGEERMDGQPEAAGSRDSVEIVEDEGFAIDE